MANTDFKSMPFWQLCEHPVARRIATILSLVGVPATLAILAWIAGTFMEIRDFVVTARVQQPWMERRITDHEQRLRQLERRAPFSARPWGDR